ncbi:hypothetical protein [uncultured Gimesia sp.]
MNEPSDRRSFKGGKARQYRIACMTFDMIFSGVDVFNRRTITAY